MRHVEADNVSRSRPHNESAGVNVHCLRRGSWFQLAALGFEWNRVELPITGLPDALDGLRIVHLSDLHLRWRWPGILDELIDRVRQDPPDLIVITGDFVDSKHDARPAIPHVQRLLRALKSRLGIFAILGNHDGDLLGPRLWACDVVPLERRRICLSDAGATIELIGLAGPDRTDLRPEYLKTIPPKQHDAVRIVLSHYPDALLQVLSHQPDVFLAGHTHGGQICLPGGFPLIRHDALPRRLCRGIHRVDQTWLIANRGIGFTGLPLRLFCPSEVIELKLIRG